VSDEIEDKCPHCGDSYSEIRSCDPLAVFECGSETWRGTSSRQTDYCRIRQLELAIKLVCSQKADDKCWMDLKPLAEMVGVKLDMHVGDKAAMLENCNRYVNNVCIAGGPWPTYSELVSMLFKCGRHAPDCPSKSYGPGDDPDESNCDCGWVSIRDKLWPAITENKQ
jgi:hypothetical protein